MRGLKKQRATTVAVCGTATETIASVTAALADAGLHALPAPTSAAVVGDARALRTIARAFDTAARIDAVVICPGIPPAGVAGRRGNQVWARTIDAALKSTFFLAKHALPRLGRTGGALVVVVPDLASDAGATARVAVDGLDCMVEALAKAAPRGVRVGAVSFTATRRRGGRAPAKEVAAAIRLLVEHAAAGTVRAVLRG